MTDADTIDQMLATNARILAAVTEKLSEQPTPAMSTDPIESVAPVVRPRVSMRNSETIDQYTARVAQVDASYRRANAEPAALDLADIERLDAVVVGRLVDEGKLAHLGFGGRRQRR